MTNLEKYITAFTETFQVNADELCEDFTVKSRPFWDSMSHLDLIMALEDTFDIMFDPEDIIEFDSFEMGKKILSKYGIQL